MERRHDRCSLRRVMSFLQGIGCGIIRLLVTMCLAE